MNVRRSMGRLLVIAICLTLLSVPAVGGFATEVGWRLVQSGSHSYSLRCPASALVRRYDPEGILHVELADHQVLSVRVHDNPSNLSVHEWTEAWLETGIDTGDGLPEYAPPVRPVARNKMSVGDLQAETVIMAGSTAVTRRTILTTASRVYLIDYPLGHETNEGLFEQILTTFETGTFAGDSGLEAVPRDTLSVPTLAVPYYSQKDPAWICDQLGTCNCNFNTCLSQSFTAIGDAGCFITSQAMIYQYYTQNGWMNPQQFDTCLTTAGAYGSWSGCVYGYCAAPYNPPSACRPSSVAYTGYLTDLNVLDSDLAQGYPAIAWIDGGSHYVVVTGKTSWGSYDVNDPYYVRSSISPGEILGFVRYSGPVPPAPVGPPSTACLKPLLRYYNNITRRHFYTSIWDEMGAGSGDWVYEGYEGYVTVDSSCYGSGVVPFHRMWDPIRAKHFYTASEAEKDYALSDGYIYEGVVGHVLLGPDPTRYTRPLYRCYSSAQDDHFYTSSWAEVEGAIGYGYVYEGVVAYIFGPEALNPPVPLDAVFVGSPTSGIAPLLVSFTNQSTGEYTTCGWTFGDGGTSSSCGNPTYTYATGGVYTVSLTVSGPNGTDTLTRSSYITVFRPVDAMFVGSPTSGIAPLLVSFTNQATGAYTTCAWSFGDGGTSSSCSSPTHTYAAEGFYTVSLTVSGPGGTDTLTRSSYIAVSEAGYYIYVPIILRQFP
jgi:PKD repeat protein